MTKLYEIYKCGQCGNIVEIVHAAGGELGCCGKPMEKISENTVDAAREKHVPVIEKTQGGYNVLVGQITHPMEEKHYIQWIELIADDAVYRKFLKPGEVPEAFFAVRASEVSVREYCNLHGLWKK
jgi:superoxide reductase